jgi:hypothetical protein
MSAERRTDILLLSALVLIHLSMGAVSRIAGESKIVGWIATVGYLIVMIVTYWRFNRDRSSILQTASYWTVYVTLLLTQRFALAIEASDLLSGIAVRFMVVVPIYLYWVVSRD